MLKKEIRRINKRYFSVITLLFADILAVVFGFFSAYLLRAEGIFRIFLDEIQPLDVYLKALPVGILILILLFFVSGLYEPKKRVTRISEMYTSLKMVTIWILLIMAGSYLYKYNYSRIIVLELYFFTAFFILIERIAIRHLHPVFFNNGFGKINVAVIGIGRNARNIVLRINRYKNLGYNFVGFIGDGKDELTLGRLNDLNKIIKKNSLDEIYIADPSLSQEEVLTLIAKCKNNHLKFKITSNIFNLITGSVDIKNLESIPSLDLTKANFPLWKSFSKRTIDIILSLFGIILTLPLWIIIILAIKLESKGPAVFSQKRIGENGKAFKMYKFRSLFKVEKYKKAQVKKNDQRVTRVGKFLRTTSLDELPQLINIIKGEMAIVGPRPEMPHIVKNYSQWEKRRLLIKPGLTGLWQVLGRKDLPLSENLEYDFYYISNHSFLLDITIMLKTIPIVFFRKGAY